MPTVIYTEIKIAGRTFTGYHLEHADVLAQVARLRARFDGALASWENTELKAELCDGCGSPCFPYDDDHADGGRFVDGVYYCGDCLTDAELDRLSSLDPAGGDTW
jgi:hypothetical protein